MKIINKCFSKEEFKKYIGKKKVARKIDKIVLHHTSDTLRQWKEGEISIGYYYLFTNIDIQGIHANSGNKGSIGVEMIGNYDKVLPPGKIWSNTKEVLRIFWICGLNSAK